MQAQELRNMLTLLTHLDSKIVLLKVKLHQLNTNDMDILDAAYKVTQAAEDLIEVAKNLS